jgi:hypothetical protein
VRKVGSGSVDRFRGLVNPRPQRMISREWDRRSMVGGEREVVDERRLRRV